MASTAWPEVMYSQEMRDKVASSRVLCVGAGGIGCELLKTLVLSGFQDIEVIDMDTIETSNLNRQFLFRRQHVGQSKAKVAAEAVQKLNPAARIVAHQANVKEPRFDVDFFRSFALVLNGLDNLEARRHVNRMCLAAAVPLVESGTTGYNGQASVHIKGRSECFECVPKPVPKSFPICTIRNTPDKPIHCVVWAKELLFGRLFGRPEASDLDGGGGGGGGEGAQPAAGADEARPSGSDGDGGAGDTSALERREGEAAAAYAARVFDYVFGQDVERVRGVEELWKARAKPNALFLADVLGGGENGASNGAAGGSNGGAGGGHEAGKGREVSACRALGITDTQRPWDAATCARVFLESTRLFLEARPDEVGAAEFDKDDDLAVEFVTAAANLRALCYGIPTQSLFDTKGMAGNIIHAIATTNAIVSGLIVIEAVKVLAGCLDSSHNTFVREFLSNQQIMLVQQAPPPRAQCLACGQAQVQLSINTRTTTLATFIDKVLKRALSISTPTIMCGDFMYEEGEDLDADEVAFNAANLGKPLASLPGGGIGHGAMVSVMDQAQHFEVTVLVAHQDAFDEEAAPDGYVLSGALPRPKAAEAHAAEPAEAGPSSAAGASGSAADDDDDSDCVLVAEDDGSRAAARAARAAAAAADPKGKRAAVDDVGAEAGRGAKRARAGPPNGGTEVIELE